MTVTRLFRSLICRRNYLFAVKDVPAQEALREKTGVESLADPRRFRRKEGTFVATGLRKNAALKLRWEYNSHKLQRSHCDFLGFGCRTGSK